MVEGKHTVYRMSASTEEEKEEWRRVGERNREKKWETGQSEEETERGWRQAVGVRRESER